MGRNWLKVAWSFKMSVKMKLGDEIDASDLRAKAKKRFHVNSIEEMEHLRKVDMDYFIDPSSIILFERLKLNKSFLRPNVDDWDNNEGYNKNIEILKDLQVINDVAERGVHLTKEYINLLTRKENQRQYLIQITDEYKNSTVWQPHRCDDSSSFGNQRSLRDF